MWYLVGKTDKERTPYLICNRTYKIGRIQANGDIDISIDGDSTVSRLHAEILIKFEESQSSNLDERANIVLTDHSKFGTFVNDVRVNEFKTLKSDDVIRFGVNNSCFKLVEEKLIVSTSCVGQAQKSSIRKLIASLGGYLLNDWHNDCSFLIMEKIMVTVKVINALICQRFIVSKKYFEDLVELASGMSVRKLNEIDYLPPVSESGIDVKKINFQPSEIRKKLFETKKLIFFNNSQLQKMQNLIELASGKCEMFNPKQHLNIRLLWQNREFFLFIKSAQNEQSDQSKLDSMLQSLDLRLVDETEIGLAILYSSLETNCNPLSKSDKKPTDATSFRLGSQSMTQTCSSYLIDDDDDSSLVEKNKLIGSVLDSQHSLKLQLENKVEDLFIVCETPPKKFKQSPQSSKKTDIFSSFKLENSQNSTKKELNFKETEEKSEGKISKKISKRIIDLFDDDEEEDEGIKFKTEAILSKKETLQLTNQKSNELVKMKETSVDIKETLQLKSQKLNESDKLKDTLQTTKLKEKSSSWSLKSQNNLNRSTIVYSKANPPRESIKSEMRYFENDEESCKIEATFPVKVKFEPLTIKKEPKQEAFTNSNSSTGAKVNFKRFKKIPKMIKSAGDENFKQEKKVNKKEDLFKSFQDEAFDVNSQFEMFMSSMK